jgi:hypothetical protein
MLPSFQSSVTIDEVDGLISMEDSGGGSPTGRAAARSVREQVKRRLLMLIFNTLAS